MVIRGMVYGIAIATLKGYSLWVSRLVDYFPLCGWNHPPGCCHVGVYPYSRSRHVPHSNTIKKMHTKLQQGATNWTLPVFQAHPSHIQCMKTTWLQDIEHMKDSLLVQLSKAENMCSTRTSDSIPVANPKAVSILHQRVRLDLVLIPWCDTVGKPGSTTVFTTSSM